MALGAWLARLGQRKQFRWQVKAQRVEAALVSFTECYKIAARMRDELHLNPGETLRETWSTERRERLAHLTEQLEDREIELHAREASEVADVDVRRQWGRFVGSRWRSRRWTTTATGRSATCTRGRCATCTN